MRRAALLCCAAAALCLASGAAHAQAPVDLPTLEDTDRPTSEQATRTRINFTVEGRQVADFGDEFATFTEATVGTNGQLNTRRVNGSVSYRFTQRIEERGSTNNDQVHSGLARGEFEAIDKTLFFQAGAFASLFNRDLRSQVSFDTRDDSANLAQTYSIYGEPRLHQSLGDFAELDLTYRVGLTEVDESASSVAGGLGPGESAIRTVSDSINHSLSARLGNDERNERIRWDLIGEATDEQVDRLDQSYRSYLGRAEVEVAVRRGVGLIGSVGYEDISNTEQPVAVDAAGTPIIGPDGDFVIDRTAPRRSIYQESGVVYDAGIRLTAGQRGYLLVRVGKRFDDFNVNGEMRYLIAPRLTVQASWTEGVQSFGRLLTLNIDGVSNSFIVSDFQTSGLLGACVRGVDRESRTGCVGDATQSITDASFKSETGQLTLEYLRTRTLLSLTALYSDRRFLDNQQPLAPGVPIDPTLTGRSDRTFSLIAQIRQSLTEGRALGGSVFINTYQFALSNGRDDTVIGASADYTQRFSKRLDFVASGYVARRDSNIGRDFNQAVVSAGLRYHF